MKCAARRVCARGTDADAATRAVVRRTMLGAAPVRRVLIPLLLLELILLTVVMLTVLMLTVLMMTVLMRVLRRLSTGS